MTHPTRIALSMIAVALAAQVSGAATPPSTRCEVGKLKTVASYASCRLKEDAKALTKGSSPDFTNCEKKINSKFPKLEEQAGPNVCPGGDGDLSDIKGRTDDFE